MFSKKLLQDNHVTGFHIIHFINELAQQDRIPRTPRTIREVDLAVGLRHRRDNWNTLVNDALHL